MTRRCVMDSSAVTFQIRSPTTEESQNQPGLLHSCSDRRCAFWTYPLKTLPFLVAGSALRTRSPQISVWMGPACGRAPEGSGQSIAAERATPGYHPSEPMAWLRSSYQSRGK